MLAVERFVPPATFTTTKVAEGSNQRIELVVNKAAGTSNPFFIGGSAVQAETLARPAGGVIDIAGPFELWIRAENVSGGDSVSILRTSLPVAQTSCPV